MSVLAEQLLLWTGVMTFLYVMSKYGPEEPEHIKNLEDMRRDE